MEKQLVLHLKLLTCCMLPMLGMLSCLSFKKKDDVEKFVLGKKAFQRMCNSCHQYKDVPNQIGPSLSELYSLDSTVLAHKIDKVASDPNHGSVNIKLSREEWDGLHYYIIHVFDPTDSK